jgi:anti-anti-sigma factor
VKEGRPVSVKQPPGLSLKTKLSGGDTSVVVANGELDFATRDDLAELLRSIEEIGTSGLVLDIRGLTFIDSAGLHVLIAAHKRALAGGWSFQVVCGPGPVWRALTLSGVTNEIRFVSRLPGLDGNGA